MIHSFGTHVLLLVLPLIYTLMFVFRSAKPHYTEITGIVVNLNLI